MSSGMPPAWDADRIGDPTFRTKFVDLPRIIGEWVSDRGGLAGRDILDFGCGEGTTALALALRHAASRVVGIDISSPDIDRCAGLAQAQLGLTALPPNLALEPVEPGALHDAAARFDVIYSWSVFEHVEQALIPRTFDLLASVLRPGGSLFIQIAPLFYSEDGSHLMAWVPEPWGHLANQHSVYMGKLRQACGSDAEFDALRSMYETLNRLTADQLKAHATSRGWRVAREYRTDREGEMPAGLLSIFNRDVLLNEQVVLLLERD
jgi:cyclopropane fatty-acyl-phospholipid synthase-like methyltransferase